MENGSAALTAAHMRMLRRFKAVILSGDMRMPKKIPMRQCLGCREMKQKRELIRVVRSPEGEVSLDFRGKKPGRGAYICHSAECFKRATKSKALSRALGLEIPAEIMEALGEQIAQDQAAAAEV